MTYRCGRPVQLKQPDGRWGQVVPVEFRLPVQADGLTLSMAKGGGLALKNTKGKTALSAPAPRMWDGAAATTTDKQPGREAKVKRSVETKNDRSDGSSEGHSCLAPVDSSILLGA
ncbi:hypothetical protein HTZ77_40650 [Nonomuraea sp. SMC257]|uniref:Uncharacterized protein n=1 Tax=Nonomuraea montanisoli TaxID=2741721 RepID=A0A7Y6IG62_9ACTN|nr:hypothetical protein [Nonomuraea montanisoli]NUW37672.1 hypothetical protein [Nonomuraea montanisoli]